MGQQFSVQTFDQQLYAIAMQVKWSRPEEFMDHHVVLGGFHSHCTYIASLGKLSGVYAPSTGRC